MLLLKYAFHCKLPIVGRRKQMNALKQGWPNIFAWGPILLNRIPRATGAEFSERHSFQSEDLFF